MSGDRATGSSAQEASFAKLSALVEALDVAGPKRSLTSSPRR